MSENKGHGNKSPNYPELDQQGSAANRAGNQQSQIDSGNLQSGNLQSGTQQSSKQDIDSQQDVGNQQSGQSQNRQRGGQHASGGTPALDDLSADLDSKNKGSIGNALNDQGGQDKQR